MNCSSSSWKIWFIWFHNQICASLTRQKNAQLHKLHLINNILNFVTKHWFHKSNYCWSRRFEIKNCILFMFRVAFCDGEGRAKDCRERENININYNWCWVVRMVLEEGWQLLKIIFFRTLWDSYYTAFDGLLIKFETDPKIFI